MSLAKSPRATGEEAELPSEARCLVDQFPAPAFDVIEYGQDGLGWDQFVEPALAARQPAANGGGRSGHFVSPAGNVPPSNRGGGAVEKIGEGPFYRLAVDGPPIGVEERRRDRGHGVEQG